MIPIDLSERLAVVTGGAGGIGRACCRTLADAGARVIVVDINLTGAREVASSLPGGVAMECDLAQAHQVVRLVEKIQADHGAPDILVNNAGWVTYRGGIATVALETWDRMLDINLRAPFLLCQGLIEGMKARGSGSIINFSSMAARQGALESSIDYASSKGGLVALTRTLAREVGPAGVRVNAVAPGMITTDPVLKHVEGRQEAVAATIPMRRLGTPEDVANVVLFLACDLSAYVTGVVVDITGGQFIG
ncbi:MAG: SDR family oxidoreductase [Chloroflexi bacterium]|nr:SDR family oxidoreductase [Chloroflexota bacterium]